MGRHAYRIWALFFLTLFACGISVMLGSLYGALISLGVGIVTTFVMAIAWTRFRGGPKEHHPPIDGLFKDMRQ
jgi:hypothetical protein